jgi:hypothetical protein
MSDKDKEPIHLWEVLGSEPLSVKDDHPAWSNLKFSVVARSMERVMEVSREVYPRMRFHSIQKRNYLGRSSVLVDKDTIHEF